MNFSMIRFKNSALIRNSRDLARSLSYFKAVNKIFYIGDTRFIFYSQKYSIVRCFLFVLFWNAICQNNNQAYNRKGMLHIRLPPFVTYNKGHPGGHQSSSMPDTWIKIAVFIFYYKYVYFEIKLYIQGLNNKI